MKTQPPSSPAPPRKGEQARIAETMRLAIVDGTYPAGSQLPNQIELARQFAVSGFTIHQALNQLEREGFIRKRQRLGTHVVDSPPHLCNLALVFPTDPATNSHYSKFYQALTHAAAAYRLAGQRAIHQFYGVTHHTDVQDRQRLLARLQAHQLAGIIFASPVDHLAGTPILDQPGVPRVAISTRQSAPHVPAVTTDPDSFLARALDHLAARGRKRIAMLRVPGLYADDDPVVAEALATRGMVSPPHWRLTIGQSTAEGARNCARLLMYGAATARPDGLIVVDDNLVEHAQAGLIAVGIRVPEDLDVVEHCNFPWPRSVLQTRRMGFDSREIVRVCIDLIDRQRNGEAVPGITRIPAVFEEELSRP